VLIATGDTKYLFPYYGRMASDRAIIGDHIAFFTFRAGK